MCTDENTQDKRNPVIKQKNEGKKVEEIKIKGALNHMPKPGCRRFPPDPHPRE